MSESRAWAGSAHGGPLRTRSDTSPSAFTNSRSTRQSPAPRSRRPPAATNGRAEPPLRRGEGPAALITPPTPTIHPDRGRRAALDGPIPPQPGTGAPTRPGASRTIGGRAGAGLRGTDHLTRRWVGAGAVLVVLLLPLLAAGPGNDLDVANIFRSGRSIARHGSYLPSRAPGSPVHETVGGLDLIGGPPLTNLFSLAAAYDRPDRGPRRVAGPRGRRGREPTVGAGRAHPQPVVPHRRHVHHRLPPRPGVRGGSRRWRSAPADRAGPGSPPRWPWDVRELATLLVALVVAEVAVLEGSPPTRGRSDEPLDRFRP